MFLSAPFGFGAGVSANLNGVPNSCFGSVVDNIPPYRDVYSYITFNSDGTGSTTRSLISGGVAEYNFRWFPQSPGIGAYYWIRFTDAGGDGSLNYGVAAGATLYPLSSARSIGLYVPGGTQGYRWVDLQCELFASASGGQVIDTAAIKIEAEFVR